LDGHGSGSPISMRKLHRQVLTVKTIASMFSHRCRIAAHFPFLPAWPIDRLRVKCTAAKRSMAGQLPLLSVGRCGFSCLQLRISLLAPFLRCRRQLLIRFDLMLADSMTCRLIQSAEIRLGRPSVSSLHLRRLRLPGQRFNLHERPN